MTKNILSVATVFNFNYKYDLCTTLKYTLIYVIYLKNYYILTEL